MDMNRFTEKAQEALSAAQHDKVFAAWNAGRIEDLEWHLARLHEVGDVIALVLESRVIAGPAWRENIDAHSAAVNLHLVNAKARHVEACRCDGARTCAWRSMEPCS